MLQGFVLCTGELFPNVRCRWRCCKFSGHAGSQDACQGFLGDLYNMWWLDAAVANYDINAASYVGGSSQRHFWRERDILGGKIHF